MARIEYSIGTQKARLRQTVHLVRLVSPSSSSLQQITLPLPFVHILSLCPHSTYRLHIQRFSLSFVSTLSFRTYFRPLFIARRTIPHSLPLEKPKYPSSQPHPAFLEFSHTHLIIIIIICVLGNHFLFSSWWGDLEPIF